MRPALLVSRAAVSLAGFVTLAACTSTGTDGSPATTGADVPGGVGHVHGLEVNPADGVLYAATHSGLFAVEGTTIRPVGDALRDTMGFTITGPDVFLASGHPGAGEPGPANLGVLRSDDSGETWHELSLVGQSDFHVLTAETSRVYGWDSTSGIVGRSDDGGRTWRNGAQLAARDLEAVPGGDGRLIATTVDGLLLSADGGDAFGAFPTPSPTPLVVIDHVPATAGPGTDGAGEANVPPVLSGLDIDGALWTFDGQRWSGPGSSMGPPEELVAVGGGSFVAAFDARIYRTDDSGRTWREITPSE